MAVILSTTGIALLAYADGIATTKTLAGVVLAAASAAGSAVYKVFFKRVFGEVSFCQVAIFFSSIGLCSLLTLWTIFLALHLTGQGNFCLQKRWFLHLSVQMISSKHWLCPWQSSLAFILAFFLGCHSRIRKKDGKVLWDGPFILGYLFYPCTRLKDKGSVCVCHPSLLSLLFVHGWKWRIRFLMTENGVFER